MSQRDSICAEYEKPTLTPGRWFGKSPASRFWAHVSKDGPIPEHCPGLGECWPWTAARSPKGYGLSDIFRQKLSTVSAHRVAWILSNDQLIPDGLFVCHKCDNPPCCNPNHLFLGTCADNNRDCVNKGRNSFQRVGPARFSLRGESSPGAKLTNAQAKEIILRFIDGETMASLSREYRISETTVSNIAHRQAWKTVWSEVDAMLAQQNNR